MEEFKNLKEIVEENEETLKEYDTYATVSLKELQNLINKCKEQEKAIRSLTESGRETLAMINLMTKFINKTGIHRRAYNCVFRNGECDEYSCEHCIREYFGKKAKGE